jgi:hypothetical protein
LGEVYKKDLAHLAHLAQKTSVSQSLSKTSGASGAKNSFVPIAPDDPDRYIEYPPTFLCVKRDKGVRGISNYKSGASGARLKEAWGFLRQKTAIMPGWAKRRCRYQAIMIFNHFWKAGEEQFFDRLREAVKDWQKTPFDSLPADMPRMLLESSDEWLDRCYAAAGFGTVKQITVEGRQ